MSLRSIMAMASMFAVAGGMHPRGGSTKRKEPKPWNYKPFMIDIETPKGHIVEKMDFGIEIGENVYSGSIQFTYVKGNGKSRNKRMNARLRELMDHFKNTPLREIKEFKQFEVTPIVRSEL